METQSLVNEDGDIDDSLLYEEPVEWVKNPLNLTVEECQLRLLHAEIKHRAVVPFNLTFKALPRANPPRQSQLRLPESLRAQAGYAAPLIDFFRLFFGDEIIDILVQNTNAKAFAECPGYNSRQWKPVDRHDISTWLGLTIYIDMCRSCNIESYWDTVLRPDSCYGPDS